MNAIGPLVSVAWLASHRSAPDIRLVDASWDMARNADERRAAFASAHIPGAVFLDIDAVSDRLSTLPHMLPNPIAFASAMRKLGLGDGSTIVIYEQGPMFSAPRLWWMLRAMGHPRVAVLDGGLEAWRDAGHPVSDLPQSPRESHFTARFESARVRDADDVRRALTDLKTQLVDARSPERFRGDAPEPRAGVRAGHAPGARNIHYQTLLDDTGRLKAPEALRSAFDLAGVDLNRPIVTTCGSGVSAAILGLALSVLGKDDWSLYDGSWAEWGARNDLPIETGA